MVCCHVELLRSVDFRCLHFDGKKSFYDIYSPKLQRRVVESDKELYLGLYTLDRDDRICCGHNLDKEKEKITGMKAACC